jgi:hypothetical protein
MKSSVLKYSAILLIGLLIEWWLVTFSPINLPERLYVNLPGSDSTNSPSVKVDGLLLVALILAVLITTLRRFLRANPNATIFKLTLIGTTICFLAEAIFQAIRQPFLNAEGVNEHLHYFLLGVIAITIFGAAFSFLIAFQLKTKKTGKLVGMIIGFVILVNIVKYFFPSLAGE